MGRSRAVARSTEDDHNQGRSKRKRTLSSVENADIASTGQALSDGRGALYHCNYCNKDISGMVRIKCAICSDFDLCVECFSVGAEIKPHKSNHPYRVMDNLSFPLICPDWNADEETLLLEGIEMYGFGNWNEVAEHVGTKTKSQCIDHYKAVYLNSPCFPLPDLSHVMGKGREELVAMAKRHSEVSKEFPVVGDKKLKEEALFSSRVKSETMKKEDLGHQSSSSFTISSGPGSTIGNTFSNSNKNSSNTAPIKDSIKVEEPQADRSFGEKKPKILGDETPSLTDLSGYNFKRQEFDVEYDNDAEQLLAEMEFKDTDTEPERELKLKVLRIYSKRLDERKRRKDFVLERNLLYQDPFEKNLSPEEKEIYNRFKVFMRFHSKEEHEELIKSVIEEHRLAKKINELQEARAAGCRTSAEANKFLEQKRKRESEENAQRMKESSQAGPSGKTVQSPHGVFRGTNDQRPFNRDSSSAIAGSRDDWDVTGFQGVELLSETEKQLCSEIRILPAHYLNMLQMLSLEIMKGNVSNKSDAHRLFKVEPSKLDRVYDMLVKKGIAQA